MTESRMLRSKALRALLWYAADGKCQRCGIALGDDWQADHVIPWKIRQRTNVHEMQALCPSCNRAKGARMYRKHQREFDELCRAIVAGAAIKRVFLSVTPGGGKSLIPMIAAALLTPDVGDAVCWVVPRLSLQDQGSEGFLKTGNRALVGGRPCVVRESTNDADPCRGHDGYITTYQALAADGASINTKEFSRKRYILILDEPHHIAEGGAYHRAIDPLIQRSALTIFMSGTWERGDGQRIAYVPYVRDGKGWRLDIPQASDEMLDYAFIRYGRAQALREQAIKPLDFTRIDGSAEWKDGDGMARSVTSLAEAGDYAPDAIYTVLRTDYAYHLLERCITDWQGYTNQRPSAKLLIVAPDIAHAREYLKRARQIGVRRLDIATSEDSRGAQASINRFKRKVDDPGALDALVTVAMAYEGLDVPQITHIACLTHIRSRPWIEQMLARAARVEEGIPYEEQWGFIYGPDDALLTAIIGAIVAEQDPFIKDRNPPGEGPTGGGGHDELRTFITPISGIATRERNFDLVTGDVVDYEESARILQALKENGLSGLVSPVTWKRVLQSYERYTAPVAVAPEQVIETPRQQETKLRDKITARVVAVERAHGLEFGTVNRHIKHHFRKSRGEMTGSELERVLEWLQTLVYQT